MLFPTLFVPERVILLDGCKVCEKNKNKFYMTVLHYMDKLKNFKFSLEIQCTSLSQWMCKQNYCHSYISAPGHHIVTLYK